MCTMPSPLTCPVTSSLFRTVLADVEMLEVDEAGQRGRHLDQLVVSDRQLAQSKAVEQLLTGQRASGDTLTQTSQPSGTVS